MNATLATAAVGTQFEELFDDVDDLIRRVADVENPEIRKMRAKVHFALVAAKGAFQDGAVQFLPADGTVGDIDDDYGPEPALGVALLVGLGLGLIVSMRQ